jgi:hypothetical protein
MKTKMMPDDWEGVPRDAKLGDRDGRATVLLRGVRDNLKT